MLSMFCSLGFCFGVNRWCLSSAYLWSAYAILVLLIGKRVAVEFVPPFIPGTLVRSAGRVILGDRKKCSLTASFETDL